MNGRGGKIVWAGRIISTLVSLLLAFSAVMKFKGGPEMAPFMEHLGLPMTMVIPLGILELTCTVIYAIPATSFLGAILLTGYMGGTICTAWRSGDPFYLQILIALCVWLGLYLRDGRLKALLPLRTRA